MTKTDYMIELSHLMATGTYRNILMNRCTSDIYTILSPIETDFMIEIGIYKDLYINRDTLEIYKLLGDQ